MLEPFGTITKYYPFLDEKTRAVIESVMGASENYRDFVVRLGAKVVSEDLSSMLAYLAIRHAFNLDLFETIDLIAIKFGEIDLINPWVIASRIQKRFKRCDILLRFCDCDTYSMKSGRGPVFRYSNY